jgi:hypothetical protein
MHCFSMALSYQLKTVKCSDSNGERSRRIGLSVSWSSILCWLPAIAGRATNEAEGPELTGIEIEEPFS